MKAVMKVEMKVGMSEKQMAVQKEFELE